MEIASLKEYITIISIIIKAKVLDAKHFDKCFRILLFLISAPNKTSFALRISYRFPLYILLLSRDIKLGKSFDQRYRIFENVRHEIYANIGVRVSVYRQL